MVINNLCREKSYGRGYAPCLYKYTRARVRRLAVVVAVWVWVAAVVVAAVDASDTRRTIHDKKNIMYNEDTKKGASGN